MTHEIETLSSRVIYQNQWMTLKEDRILRGDGNEGVYSTIEKPDFVVILPVQDNDIYVVEQYRYPLKARTIELPQGSWELSPDANSEDIAAGELREETGLVAGNMIYVGYQKLAQGYSAQGYHIYLAKDLTQQQQALDAEEYGLTARPLAKADFHNLILDGKISDATSVTAFLLAQARGMI